VSSSSLLTVKQRIILRAKRDGIGDLSLARALGMSSGAVKECGLRAKRILRECGIDWLKTDDWEGGRENVGSSEVDGCVERATGWEGNRDGQKSRIVPSIFCVSNT